MVPAPPSSPPLKIGEVARRSGLTVKTIRFYCDEGLIQPVCQATLKTEPLPTSKTEPPLAPEGRLFSESFRLGLAGG